MSKPNTEIAVAVPQGSAAATVPMAQQLKQGGKCCGSCCDYRRAVIIMSLVAILFNAIGFSAGRDPELTDNQLEDEIVSIQDDYATATLVTSIISIIMALVSLIGAIQFNQYMVRTK